MLQISSMPPPLALKASELLKHNIDGLLRKQGKTRAGLSRWCHQSRSWLDKIYSEDRRGVPIKHLDRMADFFGMTAYELLTPGKAEASERRSSRDRRVSAERRQGTQNPDVLTFMDVYNALPQQDRDDLKKDAVARLNKRLQRKPSSAAAPGTQDRTAESTPAARAPARGRTSKGTT